jgi:hypothetical protein
MKQYRFTSTYNSDSSIPDAHIDPADPAFAIATGVVPRTNFMELPAWQKDDPQNEKARIMREQGIKPGTPAWFALWGPGGAR